MTFTGTKQEIVNELKYIKYCISKLKEIKNWNIEDKKIFYEMLKKKKELERILENGLIK